ncbi:MAG: lipid IV(A) 3-deoxy-D-manno-octulosonic acid transferase [Pseudomonadales bacterium]|nr:lipid IV(A) 3-deoxy-D-manno-octulosonic acid transferase [Pseudomonadales bacterium]
MWLLIYNTLLHLSLPFVWLRLKLRARKTPAYAQRVPERFGKLPESSANFHIWFHAVSAGEVIAAAPIIRNIAKENPEHSILVTTMTVTGCDQVQRLLSDCVEHLYAPYDFPWAVNNFIQVVQPGILILMETELWPNLMRKLSKASVPVCLMNARLSERSYRGYQRIAGLSRPMFKSLASVSCQYPMHAKRLIALGVDEKKLNISGNVKFDLNLPADLHAFGKKISADWKLEGRKIWIAASTHPGEEQLALEVHRQLLGVFPGLLLLLVPRHPERFAEVSRLAKTLGFPSASLSLGPLQTELDSMQVLVCDQMGQLMYLYALADVAYMGGTMADIGGHNIIEPAALGKPVIAGPSRYNFSEVYTLFEDKDAIISVRSARELHSSVLDLLNSHALGAELGKRALQVVEKNAGAADQVIQCLRPLIRASLK